MIKKVLILTLIFGCILTTLHIIFGLTIPELQRTTINDGINNETLYTYNFQSYFQNLTINLSNFSDLQIKAVELDFDDTISAIESVLNVIALGLNILIWPIRLIAYFIRILIALFGITTAIQDSALGFIYDIVQWLIHMQIPYV